MPATTCDLPTAELTVGSLEYLDTGGEGPVVVLLHGLLMDETLWTSVVAGLATTHRCVVPVLPLGAHRRPMGADVDLSLPAVATTVVELLDRLDLHDVTLVGNDTGGAVVQLVMLLGSERLGRVVLVSCDAFDNFPPGLTGRTLVRTGRLSPALFGLFMQQMRLRPMRRMPLSFGHLTRRGDAVVKGWLRPVLHDREIRRDTVRVLRAIAAAPDLLVEVAERLPTFERPVLVVWAAGDRVMPPEHGRRLVELLPRARLVEVEDSDSLVPLDRPEALVGALRDFVGAGV